MKNRDESGQGTITADVRAVKAHAPLEWTAFASKDPWERALAQIKIAVQLWMETSEEKRKREVKEKRSIAKCSRSCAL